MPIPITLFSAICGVVVLSIFFSQNKKRNNWGWIYLVLGILLILMAIIPWIDLIVT
jgi:hypothetical protein